MGRKNPNDRKKPANEKHTPLVYACQACNATGVKDDKVCYVCDGKRYRIV